MSVPAEPGGSGARLWSFCVSHYGKPGVAAECLALQEQFGADVMVVLFAIYSGAHSGAQLSSERVAQADQVVCQWRAQVVAGLRGARRFLRDWRAPGGGADLAAAAGDLRARLQELELTAERLEAGLLAAWLDEHVPELPTSESRAAVAYNIDSVLRFYGATRAAPRHIQHV